MKFYETGKDDNLAVKIAVFLCVYLWLIFLFPAAHAQTYKNPVIPGDFPDPSVIRVGADYYATATSGNWFPAYTVMHSRDLVNWKPVGAVLTEKPAWAKGDFWAPEIVEDKGRFFVFYTARRDDGKDKKGTLCVAVATAEKPDGVWKDHGPLVCQEIGSLDADFVRDENGKPFLVWKEDGNDRRVPTWIYAQQLDESGTKLVGKPKKLFRNDAPWENHVIEGSFIVRKNGWFYHFYSGNACCGRGCNYALGVARSKTLLGKWEKNPKNPILAANDFWQCPGHGSIVETPDGRDFLLYHAYRRKSVGFNIGREALLDEVKWTSDGWATINDGRGASETAAVPFKNTAQKAQNVFIEEFDEAALAPFWVRPFASKTEPALKGGFLKLAPPANQTTEKAEEKTAETIAEKVVVTRTVSGNYEASVKINYTDLRPAENAGISVYGWQKSAVGISFDKDKIYTWQRENGNQKEIASAPFDSGKYAIYLKIAAKDGENFQFFYSYDEANWRKLGEQVNAGYIENARVALVYNGGAAVTGTRFDRIKIEQK